jgi:hypothetical protein
MRPVLLAIALAMRSASTAASGASRRSVEASVWHCTQFTPVETNNAWPRASTEGAGSGVAGVSEPPQPATARVAANSASSF